MIALQCLEKPIQGLVAWPTNDYAGTELGIETEFCLAISEGSGYVLTGEYGDGSPIETLQEPGNKTGFCTFKICTLWDFTEFDISQMVI